MNIKLLKKLQKHQPLKVEQIKTWLAENENYFYFLINESNCRKWSKWVEDKSIHILPCCCPIREEECIFIETFYKLGKIVELHQKEKYFNLLVTEYKLIKDNKIAVLDWFKMHQNVASELVFETNIYVMLELEPYKALKIKLDENEFKYIIEFQKITQNF